MQLDRVAEELASAVAEQCRAEEREHGLDDPWPLRLPVTARIAGGAAFSGRQLADVIAGQYSDRLVVVGEAGAGKTVLALELVLGLLERRRPEDPVPVLLSVSSWRPREKLLHDWVIECLGADFAPGLRELVRRRRLLLVLDGLGESTAPSVADVRLELRRDLAEQEGVVLTCRPAAYQDLVSTRAPLARVSVATVDPLRPEDVAAWMSTRDATRWGPVIDELTARPDGVVAQALSTPSMAQLACSVYAREGDPAELATRGGSRAAVEEYLLDRYLPAVHANEDTYRRLTFLALHLHRLETRELAWWRLHETVPELVRGLGQHLAAGLLFAAAFGLFAHDPSMLLWFGLGFGLGFGVHGWPDGGIGQGYAALATLATIGVASGSGIVVAAVALLLMSVLLAGLAARRRIGLASAFAGALASGLVGFVASNASTWLGGANNRALLIGMGLGLVAGLFLRMAFVGAHDRPYSPETSWSRLPKRVEFRLRGTAMSFVRRFAGGFAASLLLPATPFLFIGLSGVAMVVSVGGGFGLAVGLKIWLNAPSPTGGAGPGTLLKRDRVAALAAGITMGTLIGLGIWLGGLIAGRFPQYLTLPPEFRQTAQIGVATGLASGVMIAVTHACGGLVIARAWFALTGRLPWRVMTNLADAYERGVLRRSGGVYRFRFSRLQDWLVLACLQRAMATTEKIRGPYHRDIVARLDDLARAMRALSRAGEAVPLQQRALAITEQTRGPYHRNVAARLDDLAATLRGLGRAGEAVPLQQRALAITEQTRGPYHRDVAARIDNLAVTLGGLGRAGEWVPLQQRALAITEKRLGRDHPDVAARIDNLAATLGGLGRAGEAVPLQQRALAITEKKLGRDHPDVAVRIDNLAATLRGLGRAGEAEPLQQQALAATEKALGPDHPDVGVRLDNLGITLRALGRVGEAMRLQQRAVVITEKALGPDHPDVGVRLDNLGITLRALGQPWEAVPVHKRALKNTEKALGPNHPDVAARLDNLAGAYWALGLVREALPLQQRALTVSELVLGPDHPDLAARLSNLAGAYWADGRVEKAVPLLRRALTISEKTFGTNHPRTAAIRSNLNASLDAAADVTEP